MASFVLLCDVGNTSMKLGFADHEKVLHSYVLSTNSQQSGDSLGLSLLALLGHAHIASESLSAVFVSSVVPSFDPVLRAACERFLQVPVYFVAKDVAIPLGNRYDCPQEVGADRLMAAYAARKLWENERALIVIDFGTATTFDCVEDNAYLGGLICPGVFSSARSLAANTAKLPRISLEVHSLAPAVGRSTSTSLNHGFVFGFASMAEGLCERLKHLLHGSAFVVATGGFAPDIARVTSCFNAVRPDLLLEGLRLLYLDTLYKK